MTSQDLLIARIKQLSEEEISTLLNATSVMLENMVPVQNQIVLIVVRRILSATGINATNSVSSAGTADGLLPQRLTL